MANVKTVQPTSAKNAQILDEWRRLPRLNKELVEFLLKKFPIKEYQKEQTKDQFFEEALYISGARECIRYIEHIIKLQEKGK
jgi:hypothetical protein|tara:strand:+ start:358 stop:603 length:246 start_codon:yes stop_codon:yes gene_type:complete